MSELGKNVGFEPVMPVFFNNMHRSRMKMAFKEIRPNINFRIQIVEGFAENAISRFFLVLCKQYIRVMSNNTTFVKKNTKHFQIWLWKI